VPPAVATSAAPVGYVSPTAAPVAASAAPTSLVPAVASAAIAPATSECREFQSTVQIDGKPARAFGTVCRQPDGSWRIR
jgi:surface antigen